MAFWRARALPEGGEFYHGAARKGANALRSDATYMLVRKFRLSSRQDIEKVLRKGKILKTNHFSMRFLLNNLASSRIGFVVSAQAVRPAAGRNLLKRRAREIIKNKIKSFKKRYDVLFIFSKGAALLSFHEFEEKIELALAAAGII